MTLDNLIYVVALFRNHNRTIAGPGGTRITRTSHLTAQGVPVTDFLVVNHRVVPQTRTRFDYTHTLVEWAVVAPAWAVPRVIPARGLYITSRTTYADGTTGPAEYVPRAAEYTVDEIRYSVDRTTSDNLNFLLEGVKNLQEKHGVPLQQVPANTAGALILNNWKEAFPWLHS